ncbi:PIR Superfamily Protein [Plasmodium ovale wallikeri]|uniref:PIR Superfamily Protein n=1 Tax=Plasmodium ovale wallikeri TaxID=864142 RepID=A0A1A9APA9_PLAOA|nr:PIR Superfamily Protein [Plasmodium ovale wallikeri]
MLFNLLHDEISLDNVSILFNYWLCGMLTHIYGANNTDKIITDFSALQLKWTYFDYSRINNQYYKKCKPELSMVNHHDWDKRKKLFDYYVDYDTLSTMAKSFDDDCKYYKKIEEKKSLYEHFDERVYLIIIIAQIFIINACLISLIMFYRNYHVMKKLHRNKLMLKPLKDLMLCNIHWEVSRTL